MRGNHRKRTFRMGDHGRPSRNSVYQEKSGLKLHFKKSKHYVLTHFLNTYKRTEMGQNFIFIVA